MEAPRIIMLNLVVLDVPLYFFQFYNHFLKKLFVIWYMPVNILHILSQIGYVFVCVLLYFVHFLYQS